MKALKNFTEKNKKIQKLRKILKSYKSVLVAFSGGSDSSFLLKAAIDFLGADKVLAVTVKSEFIPEKKILEAKSIAETIGARWITIDIPVLYESNLIKNPANRCYICKKTILKSLKKIAKKEGLNQVIEGAITEDREGYRPGVKAVRELKVKSPLIEAGFSKEEIRKFSRKLSLPTWDKPSFTCLATRFPYGTRLTKKNLEKVAAAEDFLANKTFKQFRVRYHGNIARIEVPEKDFDKLLSQRKNIIAEFKKIGFDYITLDIEGYRSGSMDIGIENG
ncbi:ATP-dependent sacrificial sulfur transferase LarE [candidate division WOR-3 bacterium]|nr:ATP-dependent sacrificial sulfur transferase LarE [candidate division WOR-3 bacterium]